MSAERKRLPNMELIASINATLAKKSGENPPSIQFGMGSASAGLEAENADTSGGRKRKRKSRWGKEDFSEKLFNPGMPTVLPSNLSKDQEDAYLRKPLSSLIKFSFDKVNGKMTKNINLTCQFKTLIAWLMKPFCTT